MTFQLLIVFLVEGESEGLLVSQSQNTKYRGFTTVNPFLEQLIEIDQTFGTR